MFIKFRIIKLLNKVEFPQSTHLNVIMNSINANNEKILVCLDILGTKGYIIHTGNCYFRLKNLSSYARYKHDIKVSFVSWFIKIASFIIVIASLFLTADTERIRTMLQWLSEWLN